MHIHTRTRTCIYMYDLNVLSTHIDVCGQLHLVLLVRSMHIKNHAYKHIQNTDMHASNLHTYMHNGYIM